MCKEKMKKTRARIIFFNNVWRFHENELTLQLIYTYMYTHMKKIIKILTLVVLVMTGTTNLLSQSFTFSPLRGKRNARLEAAIKEQEAKDDSITFVTTEQEGRKVLKFRNRKKTTEALAESTADSLSAAQEAVSTQNESNAVAVAAGYSASADAHQAQKHMSWHRSSHEVVVAVILPFYLESANTKQDEIQMRMVEFYKGFLLAVNQAQLQGQHVRILTYDTATKPLSEILTDESLLQSQLIVAPMNAQDVSQVAVYGESHQIPVISPFSFRQDLMSSCAHLFQLNAPKTSLYPRLSEELIGRFSNYQFVFVKDTLFADNLDAFPEHLKSVLADRGIEFHDYTYSDPYSVVCMDSVLNLTEENVFYVLETPQGDVQMTAMLRRFFPSLKNKLFLDANPAMAEAIGASYALGENQVAATETIEEMIPDSVQSDTTTLMESGRQIAVLGYPEWQKYTTDFMDFFYDLNVWMFTKFYANPFDVEVQAFYNDFRYWYNSDLLPLYPKYGMLGYDVATYALTKLGQTGTLSSDVAEEPVQTLQSVLNFEQTEGQCFMNTGFCLVHFTPETTVEKFEIR